MIPKRFGRSIYIRQNKGTKKEGPLVDGEAVLLF